MSRESDLLNVANLFSAAALDGDWLGALGAMAAACGTERGQLIGIGADRAVPFNWISNVDPNVLTEFVALGGGDPQLNPRVRMGLKAPLLNAWHGLDCFDPGLQAKAQAYCEFCIHHDLPYGSQATLMRDSEMLIGMSTLHRAHEGPPKDHHREAFELIAPHVRDAVRMQITLEGRGAALMAGALEAVGAAAFICDASGLVRAVTAAGEEAVRNGALRLQARRLGADREEEARNLEALIAAAAYGQTDLRRHPLRTTVVHKADDPFSPIFVDVMSLPARPFSFGFEPRVLVVIRGETRRDVAFAQTLRAAFGLTLAEAEIALRLADGDSRQAIAADRGVSLETVRTQIRNLFSKIGVGRTVELVTKLGRLR